MKIFSIKSYNSDGLRVYDPFVTIVNEKHAIVIAENVVDAISICPFKFDEEKANNAISIIMLGEAEKGRDKKQVIIYKQ